MIIGAGQRSAIATLVERKTRVTMLVAIGGGHSAQVVGDALIQRFTHLPAALRRSLTWDQGNEMFHHARIAKDTGLRIYFADPPTLVFGLHEFGSTWGGDHSAGWVGVSSRMLAPPSVRLKRPVKRTEANMVFRLISRRYERASTIITSNKSFAEWGQVLGEDVLATAILDRFLHHCHVIAINGPSYRLKNRAAPPGGGPPMP